MSHCGCKDSTFFLNFMFFVLWTFILALPFNLALPFIWLCRSFGFAVHLALPFIWLCRSFGFAVQLPSPFIWLRRSFCPLDVDWSTNPVGVPQLYPKQSLGLLQSPKRNHQFINPGNNILDSYGHDNKSHDSRNSL